MVRCGGCGRFCRWDPRLEWWCDLCERKPSLPSSALPATPTDAVIGASLAESERRSCPDGGVCHHGCVRSCWRVSCCSPLSGVYADDCWPVEVRAAHRELDMSTGWECACEHDDDSGRSVVLDPFAGSGTTLKTAVERGRSAIGIELNPEYVALGRRRLSSVTAPLFADEDLAA